MPSVRSCAELGHRPVPRPRQLAHRARASVPENDVEAVGFKAGTLLRAPGEIAIAEEDRLGVPGRIVRGQIPGRRAACGRHLEQIEVGGPGLRAPGHAGGEHQGLAVGAERVVAVITVRLGGNVRIQRLGQVHGDLGLAVGTEGRAEQMRSGAVAPGVPVADEDPVVSAGRGFVLGACVEPLPGTGEQLAVGEHLHREGDAIARRRHLQRGDLQGIVADLHALAAVEAEAPHLRAARSRREEVEAVTVRGPAGARVVGGVLGEAARLPVLRPQVQQPEVGTALVGVDVGLAQDKGDVAAVGGQLWIADPVKANQILHGERRWSVVWRGVCYAGSGDDQGRGDEASDHTSSRLRPGTRRSILVDAPVARRELLRGTALRATPPLSPLPRPGASTLRIGRPAPTTGARSLRVPLRDTTVRSPTPARRRS